MAAGVCGCYCIYGAAEVVDTAKVVDAAEACRVQLKVSHSLLLFDSCATARTAPGFGWHGWPSTQASGSQYDIFSYNFLYRTYTVVSGAHVNGPPSRYLNLTWNDINIYHGLTVDTGLCRRLWPWL